MQQVAPNTYQLHIRLPDSRLSVLNAHLVKTDQGCPPCDCDLDHGQGCRTGSSVSV